MRNRRVALGTTAVAGVFALAACGSGTAAPQQQAGGGAAAPKLVSDESTPRRGTADLAVALGVPEQREEGSGQYDLHQHLRADLRPPRRPRRRPDRAGRSHGHRLPPAAGGRRRAANDVPAGKTATATISVLTPAPGAGSGWTPTHLVTIPPGQTEPLSVDWPPDLPVLRQDAATHPGTYVNGILADPR